MPNTKMSKKANPMDVLFLTDEPEQTIRKIMR